MNMNALFSAEFPLGEGLIYLNHAAVAPWPKRTRDAVRQFAEENLHFGAKNYARWLQTEALLRKQLQALINAPSIDDIALLKNTSEGLSVVAEGIDWHRHDNIVSSDEEFPSNRIPWLAQQKKGVTFREISLADDNPEQCLINACDENTRLLTISAVQYGSGRRLDLERLGQFCRQNGILFCIDAIQALGVIPFDVRKIRADFVMADAHKWLLGPEGVALFYCAGSIRESLALHQFGWHMVEDMANYDRKDWQPARSARRFECGSPNMLGIYALSASLSLLAEIGIENIHGMVMKNTRQVFDYYKDKPDISWLTPRHEAKRAGIVTFKFKGRDNSEIQRKLMENNVICACRAGAVRLSPHFYTRSDSIRKALEIMDAIV